jgi:hypothetical protein
MGASVMRLAGFDLVSRASSVARARGFVVRSAAASLIAVSLRSSGQFRVIA